MCAWWHCISSSWSPTLQNGFSCCMWGKMWVRVLREILWVGPVKCIPLYLPLSSAIVSYWHSANNSWSLMICFLFYFLGVILQLIKVSWNVLFRFFSCWMGTGRGSTLLVWSTYVWDWKPSGWQKMVITAPCFFCPSLRIEASVQNFIISWTAAATAAPAASAAAASLL